MSITLGEEQEEQQELVVPRSLPRRLVKYLLPVIFIGSVALKYVTHTQTLDWWILSLACAFGAQIVGQLVAEFWNGEVEFSMKFSLRKKNWPPDDRKLKVIKPR